VIMSDVAICAALDSGEISVEPSARHADIRSVGLRLHLADELLTPADSEEEIDLASTEQGQFICHRMGDSGYRLEGHCFVLACTRERVRTSRGIVCRVDGRSSVARNGVFVHCSSTTVDNLHEDARTVVLELFNCSRRPVRIRPGLPIAMLTFERLDGRIQQAASRQYADQQRLLPPRPIIQL
jgi:dCTP deaminase